MSAPDSPGSTIPPPMPPKCRHCGEPLPAIGTYAYKAGGLAILNLFCPHCGRDLHFQIFQSPIAEGEEPRVHIPS